MIVALNLQMARAPRLRRSRDYFLRSALTNEELQPTPRSMNLADATNSDRAAGITPIQNANGRTNFVPDTEIRTPPIQPEMPYVRVVCLTENPLRHIPYHVIEAKTVRLQLSNRMRADPILVKNVLPLFSSCLTIEIAVVCVLLIDLVVELYNVELMITAVCGGPCYKQQIPVHTFLCAGASRILPFCL